MLGGGLAPSDRGVRRGVRPAANIGAVPGGSLRGGGRRRLTVRVCLSALTLRRPRQWGACWLSGQLWRELQLDWFWAARLPASRKGTRWEPILREQFFELGPDRLRRMRVDHGGGDALMTEQDLDGAQVDAVFEKARGIAVAQHVRRHAAADPGGTRCRGEGAGQDV